jgi:hypothetical protein
VFSPTVHSDNRADESPVLDCFELFLLSDVVENIADESNKFYTHCHKEDMTCTSVSSQTVEKCSSRGTLCIFISKCAYGLKERVNGSGILVVGSPPRSSSVARSN